MTTPDLAAKGPRVTAALRRLEQRATRHLETASGWAAVYLAAKAIPRMPARVLEECGRKLVRAERRSREASEAFVRAATLELRRARGEGR